MQQKITTILPVSRTKYLDRIIDCMMNQTVEIDSLIVVFDGNDDEFISVRNKIQDLYIENKLCVKSINRRSAETIAERRWHIVSIHNQIRDLIVDADWIFSVEDDGILPDDALEKLINTVSEIDDVGMVTGVELGRWGLPYVGAWRVDDIFNPRKITSLENRLTDGSGVTLEEIDGCGLYCALIRADSYKSHEFDTRNGLGPDVNLGLYLRQSGFNNYINWGIPVTHITERKGKEIEIAADSKSEIVDMTLLSGSVWKK